MKKKCPICGQEALCDREGDFTLRPPEESPGDTITVQDAAWQECEACSERILPPALLERLENAHRRRLGLLSPSEIKAIRERAGLTQKAMAEFIGVGEKTYTRWEGGKSLQHKGSDTLIRIVEEWPEVFARLDAERNPDRPRTVREYISNLNDFKGRSWAMAAHGGELDPAVTNEIEEFFRRLSTQSGDKT